MTVTLPQGQRLAFNIPRSVVFCSSDASNGIAEHTGMTLVALIDIREDGILLVSNRASGAAH